jgi:hypothetical protein
MLKAVRIAFPDIFTAVQFQGAGPYNYRATALIVPGSANDKIVHAAIEKAGSAKWEKKWPEVKKDIEGQSAKWCYMDGNKKAYDGYANMLALTMSRPKESGPVLVLDRNPAVKLTAEDGRIYGGCYANIKAQAWAQSNDFAKGIRCSLITVQFFSDGESFGGAPQATADGFEVVESESEEFV